MDKAELDKELEILGMDREYIVHMTKDQTDWGHSFSSKDVMKICEELQITRKLRVLAPQSKYYNQDLPVIKEEYWGGWFQLRLCMVNGGKERKYTFSNTKVTISDETLAEFRLACQTREKPKDYINRDFSVEDIIFLRQFYRVKKIFGGFMLIKPINSKHDILSLSRVTNKAAKAYLIIDDPIVHLHI